MGAGKSAPPPKPSFGFDTGSKGKMLQVCTSKTMILIGWCCVCELETGAVSVGGVSYIEPYIIICVCVFQECLKAMFSGQHIPERILHGAEESLRVHPAVRCQVKTHI